MDKQYSQLAYSLHAAHDMTYVRASIVIMKYENSSFGKNALQVHGKDEANVATDKNKKKAHKIRSRCYKCKKISLFARKFKTPHQVVQN